MLGSETADEVGAAPGPEIWQSCGAIRLRKTLTIKSMATIGHVFIPLNREHDGMVPSDDDQARFESLPVPLALWEPFQRCPCRS
jgi:hypothetical protein